MAALSLKEGAGELDLEAFAQYARQELPAYAMPVFLRIQSDIDVTGTFKMVKGDLREQAYDIDAFEDPVYVLLNGSQNYQPLDAELVARINAREAGF